jgi:hypothetical protein
MERIEHVNQVLLTTTELATLSPDFLRKATLWQVILGQITPVDVRDVL